MAAPPSRASPDLGESVARRHCREVRLVNGVERAISRESARHCDMESRGDAPLARGSLVVRPHVPATPAPLHPFAVLARLTPPAHGANPLLQPHEYAGGRGHFTSNVNTAFLERERLSSERAAAPGRFTPSRDKSPSPPQRSKYSAKRYHEVSRLARSAAERCGAQRSTAELRASSESPNRAGLWMVWSKETVHRAEMIRERLQRGVSPLHPQLFPHQRGVPTRSATLSDYNAQLLVTWKRSTFAHSMRNRTLGTSRVGPNGRERRQFSLHRGQRIRLCRRKTDGHTDPPQQRTQ